MSGRGWMGMAMVMLTACTEVTGHRSRFHWTTRGPVLQQPSVEDIHVGFWGEDGGFQRRSVTPLENGEFRWKDAPAGEYLVGVEGDRTWIHTDARVLDLDQLGEFGLPDASVLPEVTLRVTRDGQMFPGLIIFSPDTNSYTRSGITVDGGLYSSATFGDFPSEGTDAVQSWLWERGSSSEVDGGFSRSVNTIEGWTRITGLPTGDELPVSLSRENEVTVAGQLPGDAVLALADQFSPTRRGFTWAMGLSATPRVAKRPDRSVPRPPSPGFEFVNSPTLPPTVEVSFLTHNPFPAADWQMQWSWSLGVRTGTPSERTGNATIAWGSTQPPTKFEVTLTPPRLLTIDGFDAREKRPWASTSPVVSWQAPERGTPSGYSVEFVDESSAVVRRLLTTSTSVHLPPGFTEGALGVIRVRAMSTPKLSWAPHPPLDYALEFTSAATVSVRPSPSP